MFIVIWQFFEINMKSRQNQLTNDGLFIIKTSTNTLDTFFQKPAENEKFGRKLRAMLGNVL